MNEIYSRLMKFLTDPEHLKENFESLDTYLEGLSDSLKSESGSQGISDVQAYLAMLFAIFGLSREQRKKTEGLDVKINSLTEQIVKLQKEFDLMKEGK